MNRTIIIVKAPGKRREWALARLHWEYGEPVETWLREGFASHAEAYELVCQGHREDRDTAHQPPEHETFRTLSKAKAWAEHITLAVHNGRGWKISHRRGG